MSLTNKTINSSLFILLIRGVQRSLGIVSFLILARYLSPEDFGIVALATMLVFLCDVISESGTNQYIIQKKDLDKDDIDTAWSLGLCLKSLLGIVLILIAPLTAEYFETPELTLAVQIIALILPISALISPKTYLLKRELNYKPIAKIEIYQKVVSFIVSVCLAIWLQNYWAMIIGVLTSYISKIIFSYVFCFTKPKFTLINLVKQWSFSKWILLKAILGYMKSEIDTVFVSKLYSVEVLGGFNMMKNLSMIPSREIIQPLAEPLLSTFSKVKEDTERFNSQVLKCTVFLLVFTAPCTLGLWLYSELLVQFLLGDKWVVYSEILGALSFFIINFSVASVFQQALISVAKVKILFYYDLFTFLGVLVLLLFIFEGSVFDFAIYRVIFAALSILILIAVTQYFLKFNIFDFIIMLIPIIAALYVASLQYLLFIDFEWLFIELFVNGMLFLIAYLLTLICVSKVMASFCSPSKEIHYWFGSLMKNQLGRLK